MSQLDLRKSSRKDAEGTSPRGWRDRLRWSVQAVQSVLRTRAALSHLVILLLLGVLLAIMTGPEGDGDHPLRGMRQSVLAPRVLWFLGLAVLLWLVLVAWRAFSPLLRPAREQVGSAVSAFRTGPTRYRALLYLALLAFAVLYPRSLSSGAQTSLLNEIGPYALLGLGLNVVVGFAGLLDLGYIAFYAIGAYSTAYFTSQIAMPWHAPFVLNPFFVFPLALLIAALAGVILGGPTLRLRGDYLAIVTLGFGEIVRIIANTANGTNGSRGVSGGFKGLGVPSLSVHLGPIDYDFGIKPLPLYYLLVGLVVLTMMAFSALDKSRIGRGLAAIREDEVAAEAMGVPTLRYKLLAFAIGASTSGTAGVLLASHQFFNPQTFTFRESILVLTIVIFGGMGSIFGPVLGAVVLQGLAYYLRDRVPADDRYMFFGAIIVLMMVFRPQGLLPSIRRGREIALAEEGLGSADSLGGRRA